MKNHKKTAITFILAVVMSIGCLFGCGGDKEKSGSGEVELFSAYMTKVVKQDDTVSEQDKLNAGFYFVCGRGDNENAQLIMTAKSDVESYNLTVSDLTNEKGDKFSADNFQIFNQKYVNVITPTKGESGDYGYFPDAILPFEKAVEYKENCIKEGKNQAIIVQATVPSEQSAGNYIGNFTLTVDGKDIQVPVSMKIYDVELPKTTGLESLYIYSRYELTGGEADDSLEMMKKYYDKLLEYKCMGYFLPVSQGDPVGYAQAVREYYDKISNYAIPYSYITQGSFYLFNVDRTWDYIVEILKLSVEDEKPYLSKVANYYGVIDEPIGNGTIDKCNTFCDSYNEGIKELAGRIREYANGKQLTAGQLEIIEKEASSVEIMPNYVTAYYHDLVKGHVVNYCPTFERYDNEVQREKYANIEGKDWYYGCTSPRNPYATFHIDDHNHLESTQLVGWTSNEYDVSGTLYWEVVNYRGYQPSVGYDMYELAAHSASYTSNGEGWLFYPGAPYGISGPVATLRLVSAREGCEDYDLLQILEKTYAEKGYDAQNALEIIYRTLYNGTKCINNNHATLAMARESVFNLIELAQKKGVFITNTERTLKGYKVEGVAPSGESVKVNGNEINSNGSFCFETELLSSHNEYLLTCGNYKVDYSVNGKKSKIFGSDTEKKIRINQSSDYTVQEVDGGEFGLDGNISKITFKDEPDSKTFYIVGNDFEKSFNKNTQDALFYIYNPTDERVECEIKSQGVSFEFSITSVFLRPGMNEISLGNLSVLNWNQNKELQYISFKVDGNLKTVYLCDVYIVSGV